MDWLNVEKRQVKMQTQVANLAYNKIMLSPTPVWGFLFLFNLCIEL